MTILDDGIEKNHPDLVNNYVSQKRKMTKDTQTVGCELSARLWTASTDEGLERVTTSVY